VHELIVVKDEMPGLVVVTVLAVVALMEGVTPLEAATVT
jgi:hypothetical protein